MVPAFKDPSARNIGLKLEVALKFNDILKIHMYIYKNGVTDSWS